MNFKEISFWVIGIATLIYCLVELGFGLAQHSLTLLSDGFHNLSDVISLYIAYWSSKASRRGRSDIMSYGWKRTEILGALTNGIFLVSLAVYITLETIPEILEPQLPPSGGVVIIIAFFGLLINTVATVVFHFTGQSHGHSHAGGGHGHSHGGGDHGHSHGSDSHGHSHSEKKKAKKEEEISLIEDFHSGEKKKKEGHGHSHGDNEEGHGHSHSHGEKKKKEGHGHSHGDINGDIHSDDGHGHSHSHGEKKNKEEHGHSHSHGEKKSNKDEQQQHGHSHSSQPPPKKKKVVDANVKAVCLHYFGDMVSSFFVLVMGIIIYFTPNPTAKWLDYVDPITSLFIVLLILVTTIPLIKGCFLILLQRTPQHIDLQKLKSKILKLNGVLNVHDFHVWQLVDGMIITSLHINVEESIDFNHISRKIKKLLHKAGIHSSAIQPEFVNAHHLESNSCLQNCVKDCAEDWCCKEEKPKETKKTPLISSSGPNSKITYSQIEPL